MNQELYNLLDEVINDITSSHEFIRLKKLQKEIEDKYQKEIMIFKREEAYYLEQKDLLKRGFIKEVCSEKFIKAKTSLYEKDEVKEYFVLERLIKKELTLLSNELNELFSNKFKEQKIIG